MWLRDLPGDPNYNQDGNLVSDGDFAYGWDAENRLISITPNTPWESGDKLLEFEYDYLGRRVFKHVWTHDGSDWQLTESLYFIHEDWKVVLVMDALAGTVLRKYTWGLDLSGTLNGAGGVGGVLACYDTNGTAGTTADDQRYWFLHDANGNVSQILKFTPDPAAATLAAHYEYDPYGNTLTVNDVDSSGVAQANPFRFSTKWLDDDLAAAGQNGAIGGTGLYSYGYRYYSPQLGRWVSRDPLEEESGPNLYEFVGNHTTNAVDPDGRALIMLGGALGSGDPELKTTVNELFFAERLWYLRYRRCTQLFGGVQFISSPTGPFALTNPDWGGAIRKLQQAMLAYMEYLGRVQARQEAGECVCPEYLHIVGYSDGATTLARAINGAYIHGVNEEMFGLVGLIDLVRYYEIAPNANEKQEWVHTFGTRSSFQAVRSTRGGWRGYEIRSQWSNLPVDTDHFGIPDHSSTVQHLLRGMNASMEKLIEQCTCDE